MKSKINILAALGILLLSFNQVNNTNPYGIFKYSKMVLYTDTNIVSSGLIATAMIYETPKTIGLKPYKTIKDGKITLNGIQLGFNNNLQLFTDSLNRNEHNSVSWSVNNSRELGSFNHEVSKGLPVFKTINNIPNQISKSKNLNIEIGSNDYSRIEVGFLDENNQVYLPLYRIFKNNANKINYSKNDLLILKNNYNSQIRITFVYLEEKMVNSKKIIFENRLDIIKNIYVIN